MKRNTSIDVIKGICIILVLLDHLDWTYSERLHMLMPFWQKLAIPLFMLVSGYVFAQSFKRNGVLSFEAAYLSSNGRIVNRIIRYTLPFLIAWIIELVAFQVLNIRDFPSVTALLKEFLTGGLGLGSYYYPIIMQFTFVFPVIYLVILKYHRKGLLLCAAANVLYELLQWAYGLNEATYRLLVFRYILLIAAGCYFALGGEIRKVTAAVLFAAGLLFVYLDSYLNIRPFFITYWTSTCFLTSLHAIALFSVLKNVIVRFKPLEILGRASYHIFLAQMVFFNGTSLLNDFIPFRPLRYCIYIVICLLAGIVFYAAEQPINDLCAKTAVRKIYKTEPAQSK